MSESFVAAPDVLEIIKTVVVANPQFHFLEVLEGWDSILCLRSIGGSPKKLAYVKGLRGELAMLSGYRYILCVMDSTYNILSEEDKAKVIFHQLLHITPEFDGKTVAHDIGDFRAVLDKYGVHYLPQSLEGVA